jgi:hypothetical protein
LFGLLFDLKLEAIFSSETLMDLHRTAWRTLCRLMEFENSVLRGIFGYQKVEVTGGHRELHIEKFHNLQSSPNV